MAMGDIINFVWKWDFIVFQFATEVGAGWTPWNDWLVKFRGEYLAYILLGVFILIPLVADLISRLAPYRKQKWEVFWVGFISAAIARFGIAELVRLMYDRERPFQVIKNVHQVIVHESGSSFPSGHATFFFALAAAVSVYHPKTGIFFFVGAILMGIARVSAGIHWPSDILAGAMIGTVCGLVGPWIYTRFIRPKLEARKYPSASGQGK